MAEATQIECKFSSTRAQSSQCGGRASEFVRPHKSGRLVPLCVACLQSFKDAQVRLASAPGERPESLKDVGYETVSLVDGEKEWLAQPPKA